MGWFDARCPVDGREQRWIEESMSLFRRDTAAGAFPTTAG